MIKFILCRFLGGHYWTQRMRGGQKCLCCKLTRSKPSKDEDWVHESQSVFDYDYKK